MSVALDHPENLIAHRRPPSLPGGTASDPCWEIDEDELASCLRGRCKRQPDDATPATLDTPGASATWRSWMQTQFRLGRRPRCR
jgi:hypothetical protein